MKRGLNISFSINILLSCLTVLLFSCKKTDEITTISATVTTSTATLIGQNWATLQGVVNAANQTVKVAFEYDTTTVYKHIKWADPDTITGSVSTQATSSLTGLKANTTYYYRIIAILSSDTIYGDADTFITTNPGKSILSFNDALTYGSVTDVDNNVYKTIDIGTQTWMAENLKATRLNDGTGISFAPDATGWTALSVPGYCWYNNDSVIYGALYNWQAASQSNICPSGWHIPSENEWTMLTNFLGGESLAGKKLKETGTTHWLTSPDGTTNETGFTALPGGYRNSGGTYGSIRRYGYWWSSTESSTSEAICINIFNTYASADRTSSSKSGGFSIRCIKD